MLTDEDFKILHEKDNYLERLNRYFKLSLSITHVPYSDKQFEFKEGTAIAIYSSSWRRHFREGVNDQQYKYGEIIYNCELLLKYSKEQIFETVRHELAHAIVDMRLGGEPISHGEKWIKVAKLLRCDVSRYQKCCH